MSESNARTRLFCSLLVAASKILRDGFSRLTGYSNHPRWRSARSERADVNNGVRNFMFPPEIELFLGRSADGCGRTERFSVGHCKSKLFWQNAGGKKKESKIRDAQPLMERFGAEGWEYSQRCE